MPMELVRKTIASLGMLGSFWFSSARPPRRNLGNFEFRHPCLDHIWHVETSTHTRVHVPREWHRGLHFHARSPEVILPMVNSPDFSTPLSMVSDAKTNAEQIVVFEVRRAVMCLRQIRAGSSREGGEGGRLGSSSSSLCAMLVRSNTSKSAFSYGCTLDPGHVFTCRKANVCRIVPRWTLKDDSKVHWINC